MKKWSKQQRENFKATVARKKAKKITTGPAPADLPVVEISNGHTEADEFAKFMAAAWRVYKGR